MCCNADILFCVLVLHWATSKEQKEDDSVFRSSHGATGGGGGVKSGGGGGGGAHRATIGSYVSRSRRLSSSSSGVEKPPSSAIVARPDSALDNKLIKHATITTECKGKTSSMGRSTRHFGGAGWDAGEVRQGIREDEVELNNIRVQTIQTREVEVDVERERKMSAGASTDDEWVGSRKGVVGERMF